MAVYILLTLGVKFYQICTELNMGEYIFTEIIYQKLAKHLPTFLFVCGNLYFLRKVDILIRILKIRSPQIFTGNLLCCSFYGGYRFYNLNSK